MPTQLKSIKEIPPISEWGVDKYDVPLVINNVVLPCWEDLVCSLDVEDDEEGNFVGIGIYDSRVCWYWSDWELAKQLIIPKFIAHNGVSDLRKLQAWGFKIDESWLLYDTQLMGHILDSSRKKYGLKTLVCADLGIEYPSYEDLCGKKTSKNHINLLQLPLELVANYNAMDCYTTYKLAKYQQTLNLKETLITKTELACSFIFYDMSEKGIRIDKSYINELNKILSYKMESIENKILNELGDINLDSPKQLLEALHEKGIEPILKKKPSTDKRALEKFRGNPLIDNLLTYSELSTLLSGFVVPYLENEEDVIHPHYQQTGTRTGRPSCTKPNLLNIPKHSENGKLVRRMFISEEGNMFGECDYSNGEPRILAHLSKDTHLCQLFNDGIDFHSYTAENLNLERNKAKVLNLSVGYRATRFSVADQLKCGNDFAQVSIDKWWSLFPELYDYENRLIYQAKKDGYFTTLLGRRIKVDGLNEHNVWKKSAAERQLVNNIAQASLQEVTKLAMIQCRKNNINMIVQVYDSLLIEEKTKDIENAVKIMAECMENAYKLDIPLIVDAKIGSNWAEMEKC